MLDGKILRGLTGMPMRKIAFANMLFALAEPEPFTLANLTTKSFMTLSSIGALLVKLMLLAPVYHPIFPQE